METISLAQAIVGIAILHNEANERTSQYGCFSKAYEKAVAERAAYRTVLNILANVK